MEAMDKFRFNENLTFKENCEKFLDELEGHDSELTTILRENWDRLTNIVRSGNMDPTQRAAFNERVASRLDALAETNTPQVGQ